MVKKIILRLDSFLLTVLVPIEFHIGFTLPQLPLGVPFSQILFVYLSRSHIKRLPIVGSKTRTVYLNREGNNIPVGHEISLPVESTVRLVPPHRRAFPEWRLNLHELVDSRFARVDDDTVVALEEDRSLWRRQVNGSRTHKGHTNTFPFLSLYHNWGVSRF